MNWRRRISGIQQTTGGRQKLTAMDGGALQGKLHARDLVKRSIGVHIIDSAALYDGATHKQAENWLTKSFY
jgi:hypothetical protein